ncbi:MAG: tRNA (guanine-N1)-methyltransferase [Candidatus Micrarchaeota archaeon]|nr:tRNA (guanine-N1)-methyltransferase [Candidatus Micrarchaeota archaeon]
MDRVSYRDELRKEFGRDYDSITKSYDVLGNIAITEGDRKTALKKAKAIFRVNKNVKTVVRKIGAVSGRYRTRKYEHVAGERNFIATYRENNCVFRFDIRKTFFSPRLAFERDRIARLSKDRENVIVMFAGVGPFAIEIAKRSRNSRIIAMELNRNSYRYMANNIALNRTTNVVQELGDVKRLVKRHPGFADRIIMPLPMESHKFLRSVDYAAAAGCVVHYYAFGDIDDPYKRAIDALKRFFNRKRKLRITGKRIVRPYSPMESEVVIDFVLGRKVSK